MFHPRGTSESDTFVRAPRPPLLLTPLALKAAPRDFSARSAAPCRGAHGLRHFGRCDQPIATNVLVSGLDHRAISAS